MCPYHIQPRGTNPTEEAVLGMARSFFTRGFELLIWGCISGWWRLGCRARCWQKFLFRMCFCAGPFFPPRHWLISHSSTKWINQDRRKVLIEPKVFMSGCDTFNNLRLFLIFMHSKAAPVKYQSVTSQFLAFLTSLFPRVYTKSS